MKKLSEKLICDARVVRMAVSGFTTSQADKSKKYPAFVEIPDMVEAAKSVNLFRALYPDATPNLDAALVSIDLSAAQDEDLFRNASSMGQAFIRFKSMTESLGTNPGETVKIYKITNENGSMFFELRKV